MCRPREPRCPGRPEETRRMTLRLMIAARGRAAPRRPVHRVQLVDHQLHVRLHVPDALENLGYRRHHAAAHAIHHHRLPVLHEHHLSRRAVVARAYRPRDVRVLAVVRALRAGDELVGVEPELASAALDDFPRHAVSPHPLKRDDGELRFELERQLTQVQHIHRAQRHHRGRPRGDDSLQPRRVP